MPTILSRRVVGDPILRKQAKLIDKNNIGSAKIQTLIRDMLRTLKAKEYGIAIAAPQVGESIALVVIDIKKTPTRPDIDEYSAILINPKILKYLGKTEFMRDGCISVGAEDDPLYGWSERYPKVVVEWLDEAGNRQQAEFDGLLAHVMQHEIDHLNGRLFIDLVKDSKTYIHASEYLKIQKHESNTDSI